jgi:hypothetical protein
LAKQKIPPKYVTSNFDKGYLFQIGTSANRFPKGVCQMNMPKSLAAWCTVLFFLVFGLDAFLTVPFGATLAGLFALGAAVFTFLGR